MPQRSAVRTASSLASEATVVAVQEGAIELRVGRGPTLRARNAVLGWSPSVGDRVVVVDSFVVGVLAAATREIRDGAGALVARWHEESRTLHLASAGDLVLDAAGKVVVRAGTDLELHAANKVDVSAAELDTTLDRASVHANDAEMLVERATLTARELVTRIGRVDARAQRVIEKVGEAYREVEGLLETRLGRARTLVKEGYRLLAHRTDIASRDDTTIDGKRVLLG